MDLLEVQGLKLALDQLAKGQDRLIEGQAQMIDRLDHLDDCVDEAKRNVKDLEMRADVRFNKLEEMMRSIVPDGDFDGHRAYHVQKMNQWKRFDSIKGSVMVKVLEWAAVMAIGWVCMTVWGGVKISLAS